MNTVIEPQDTLRNTDIRATDPCRYRTIGNLRSRVICQKSHQSSSPQPRLHHLQLTTLSQICVDRGWKQNELTLWDGTILEGNLLNSLEDEGWVVRHRWCGHCCGVLGGTKIMHRRNGNLSGEMLKYLGVCPCWLSTSSQYMTDGERTVAWIRLGRPSATSRHSLSDILKHSCGFLSCNSSAPAPTSHESLEISC